MRPKVFWAIILIAFLVLGAVIVNIDYLFPTPSAEQLAFADDTGQTPTFPEALKQSRIGG
ncbi:hypothetical protein HY642_05025 [Candidatus Woesearchaeota archaeon]|nr:hypothetical protein [Candidatus Woesearchaeota archaeon]